MGGRLQRLRWWRKAEAGTDAEAPPLEGWPREFSEAARALLYEMAQRRTRELTEFVTQQDGKATTLFGISVLVAGAGSAVTELRWALALDVVLAVLAALAAVAAWTCAVQVYRVRNYETGENVRYLATEYRDATTEEIRDASLETTVDAFDSLVEAMNDKGPWLRKLLWAVVVQSGVTFALLLLHQI